MDNKPSLIVPICGASTRFPNVREKPFLTHPDGQPMVLKSIEGLQFDYNLYIVTLKEHVEKYGHIGHIDELCDEKINWIILDKQTEGQAHTVYEAIKRTNLTGHILIKDCDNYLVVDHMPKPNSVAVYDLRDLTKVNAGNKSYIQLASNGSILTIDEKRITSGLFSCGLYSFKYAEDYAFTFERSPKDCYVSYVIQEMLNSNVQFNITGVQHYIDWGTLAEWREYCGQFMVLFVDCDGVLVENSAEYMKPYWGTTSGIQKNIDRLNELSRRGTAQIIITTSRKAKYENITRKQLDKLGLRYSQIVFGLQHGKRIVINDYSDSNPYPSCDAINLRRNGDDLEKLL